MSRADFLKTVTATCDWPTEYSSCGLVAPFAEQDGDVECAVRLCRLCAYHVAIQAAADLEGDMRTLLIEHMRAQWRSIDQAAIDTGAKR